MKIILSRSGGGKTTKIAELMAELSHNGEESLVISGELNFFEFKEYAIRAEADLEKLRYAYVTNLEEIVEAISNKEDERIKTIFIDNFPVILTNVSKGESDDYILKIMNEAEATYGKSIYATLQTNIEDTRLNGEKLVVVDYKPETAN